MGQKKYQYECVQLALWLAQKVQYQRACRICKERKADFLRDFKAVDYARNLAEGLAITTHRRKVASHQAVKM
jgi:hypothetical protein